MGKSEDLIAQLPQEYQEWAAKWAPVLLSMAEDEVERWVHSLLYGPSKEARKILLKAMTPEQFKANLEATNEALRAVNKKAASLEAIHKQMLVEAAAILWLMARAALLQ